MGEARVTDSAQRNRFPSLPGCLQMAGKKHARWQRLSTPLSVHTLQSGSFHVFGMPETPRLKSGFGLSADLKSARLAAQSAALALLENNRGV